MTSIPPSTAGPPTRTTDFPGTRAALVLLLLINLFNYIDRQVLAAVVAPLKQTFFGASGGATGSERLDSLRGGRLLAGFYRAMPGGGALGYVLGGAVARSSIGEFGGRLLGVHTESWRWAFYLVVLPGLALAVASFFMREPPRGQADLGPNTES